MISATRSRRKKFVERNEGEFIWLISLSDLMMLLFVFFVVLFSFASKKLSAEDYYKIKSALGLEKGGKATPVDEIQVKLLAWATDRKLLDSVQLVRKEDSLILEIKERLLFNVGESQLKTDASGLLPLLREALLKIPGPYRIGIEGHSDDTPIAGKSGNWSLSTQRALTVHAALQLPKELEERTVIMGYGPTRPLAPNRNEKNEPIPANQAQNRRVTIRVF